MFSNIYKSVLTVIIFFLLLIPQINYAQVPTCDPSVPFYQVNLTGRPDSIWYSPGHSRNGNCCSTVSPDRCTSFEVILDTGAAMINFNIASGAIPTGSMFYQINCGPKVAVGHPICIVGAGPHHVTFCKPGNNQNTYFIQSIPKPTFPKPQHVRIGCYQTIKVLGLDTPSVTWTSVYPGTPGQYNSYLSCTAGCVNPVYTPATNAPAYVDYKICGTPIATACGYVALCDTVRIYNESVLTATVNPNPAGFCASGSGVILTATASGGYGAYSYIWRDQTNSIVGTAASYTATNAGIFSVEIRDALYNSSSCPSTFVSVPVTVTNLPVVNAGLDQTLCATSPTAYLNGNIQYASGAVWNGGAGIFNPSNTNLNASYTPTAAEILSGTVTLTLTSTGAGGGCTNASDVIVLHYPPQLSVNMTDVNVACHDGQAVLTPTVTGGTLPYTYLWNNGSSGSSLNVGHGNYCVSVTDDIGCNAIVCANVISPSALALSLSETNVTVNGGSDGTATANPSGGTSPYAYSWAPGGQTTQSATGLAFGIYTVTVTDSKGCSIYSSIVVNEPRCAAFSGTVTANNVLCNGNANGSATVTASGGTGPYAYSWNDALHQTTNVATGLVAGTYIIVVTDGNGCLYSSGVVITEPTQLNNTMNQTNVTVIGGNNGSATSNPSGGSPGYTYNWSNSGNTQTISSLTAGTYILQLSDSHNCSLTDSVKITQPPCQNLIIAANIAPVSCHGGNDGSASVTALHGNPPYLYSWSSGEATSTVNNMSAGSYVVTVTDALNCITFKNITVSEPSVLGLALSPTAISCNTKNDGTIELTVSGGTFPYSFNWSNGLAVEDLINLSDGSYSVTVTDAKGCQASSSTSIVRPPVLSVSNTFTNVTCNGGSDGAINLTASGGVLPYSYLWNTTVTTPSLTGLSSGQYSAVVTDANGCKVTTPLGILIDQPDPVSVLSHSVSCPAPGSGVAQIGVVPSGGWGSTYQISFDNGTSYQSAGVYEILLPVDSFYVVQVKDINNCNSVKPDTIWINPETVISAITFNKCQYGPDTTTQLTVTASGGAGFPYTVSLDGGITYQTAGTYSYTVLVDSVYSLVVKDSLGCVSLTGSANIPAIFVNTYTVGDFNGYSISCFGLNDGSIALYTAGGTLPYSYSWSNGSPLQNQSALTAGSYSVVVSDNNNCLDTLQFDLTEPTVLANTISSMANYNGHEISCFGLSDGGIDQVVSGGVVPYAYQWSNTATTLNINGVPAGTYSVIVTDLNNCKDTAYITLTQPAVLTSSITITSNYNGNNISCFGYNDGSLTLAVNGGTPAYTYAWNNGSSSQNLSSLTAGNYHVVITDLNNCKDSADISLTQPAPLTLTVVSLSNYNGYNISCYRLSNGSIDVNVTGGTINYSYSWSNGSSNQDLNNIVAGTYSVVVTDANLCKDTLTVTLDQPIQFVLNGNVSTSYNGYAISCYNGANGGININATGGVPAYAYAWSNGSGVQNQTGLTAGSYSVVATDLNGCTDTLQYVLNQPDSIYITASIQNVLCNGFHNGSIDETVSGGVNPFTYVWSTGSTGEDINGLSMGVYSVTVTDLNGCLHSETYTVTETSPIILSLTHADISCNGLMNGSVTSFVNGGTPAYSYQWSGSSSSTASSLSGLAPGMYILTVMDANNCSVKDSSSITQPAVLDATVTSPILSNGHNVSFYHTADGNITSAVTGGTTPYVYTWSNGASTQNLNNVGAGNYTLQVTDNKGCVVTATITLTEPLALEMPSGISPNGDGLNDYFVVHGIEAYPDNLITVFNRWGNVVYEKSKYANTWAGKSNGGADLPDGTYFVVLKINNTDITLKGYVDIRR
ncbi:MAG: T9SS type B sorting domain-containing protein [Bacteroidia bacterium]